MPSLQPWAVSFAPLACTVVSSPEEFRGLIRDLRILFIQTRSVKGLVEAGRSGGLNAFALENIDAAGRYHEHAIALFHVYLEAIEAGRACLIKSPMRDKPDMAELSDWATRNNISLVLPDGYSLKTIGVELQKIGYRFF